MATTRTGSTYNRLNNSSLNSSKPVKTPPIRPAPPPKPTVVSLASELAALNSKYTMVLSRLDELLPLKNKVEVLETECDALRNEILRIKTTVDNAPSTTEAPSKPAAFYDLEGNVVKLINSKPKKKNKKVKNLATADSTQNNDPYPPPDYVEPDGSVWMTVGSSRYWNRNGDNLRKIPDRQRKQANKKNSRNVSNDQRVVSEDNIANDSNPRIWLFVSKCPVTTTVDDIVGHVKSRFNVSAKVVPLISKDADISKKSYISFKVRMPVTKLNAALKKDNWPEGCTVREFKDKRNNPPQNDFLWERPHDLVSQT